MQAGRIFFLAFNSVKGTADQTRKLVGYECYGFIFSFLNHRDAHRFVLNGRHRIVPASPQKLRANTQIGIALVEAGQPVESNVATD